MSNPALVKAPSVSTLEHISSVGAGDPFSNRLTLSRSRSRSDDQAPMVRVKSATFLVNSE